MRKANKRLVDLTYTRTKVLFDAGARKLETREGPWAHPMLAIFFYGPTVIN